MLLLLLVLILLVVLFAHILGSMNVVNAGVSKNTPVAVTVAPPPVIRQLKIPEPEVEVEGEGEKEEEEEEEEEENEIQAEEYKVYMEGSSGREKNRGGDTVEDILYIVTRKL